MTSPTPITPLRIAVVGAGSRGSNYARLAAQQGAVITAVVDPNEAHRAALLDEHDSFDITVFEDWLALADSTPRVADAVIIATPDRQHTDPAIGLAEAGYHLLLEKPMAPTEAESLQIVEAARDAGVMLAVCHVMRYSSYTTTLKALLNDGAVGDIVSVEHLEPVGWWHFAHSYVRGNWRREEDSNPMLMAKSSHDIDWLSYVIGKRAVAVSSFGGLYHFTAARKPAGAADRCVDCPLQYDCAYSATRIYPPFLRDPVGRRWPLGVLTTNISSEGIDQALREGPYGECVFNGQNDVVDHQVVNIEYEHGVTASFTVTAFTELDFRKTRVFGTEGSIDGDGKTLTLTRFIDGSTSTFTSETTGQASAADGHGGADADLIATFLGAVSTGNPDLLLSGPEESLDSHRIVWWAEQSRATGTTIHIPSPDAPLVEGTNT